MSSPFAPLAKAARAEYRMFRRVKNQPLTAAPGYAGSP